MVNCCTGIYRPTEGRVFLGDTDVTRMRTNAIARLGISRTFQNLALFRGMTVLENLMVGRYLHGKAGIFRGMLYTPGTIRDEERQRERVEQVIDLLRIARYRDAHVADLPYGLQKRVELGRALVQDPRLVFLDEPMAGMSLEEKEDMARFILDVHESRRGDDAPHRARHGSRHERRRAGRRARLRQEDRRRHARRRCSATRR